MDEFAKITPILEIETISDDECDALENSEPKEKRLRRRYSKSWERLPDFKGWLRKSEDPDFLAYCTYCCVHLKASGGRAHLKEHSETLLHRKQALLKLKSIYCADTDTNGPFERRENVNVEENDDRICMPKVYTKAVIGQPAPYFEGVAVHEGVFQRVSSIDFLGKYLVLMFYSLDFTFVCPTEIISFSNNIEKFRRLKAEVVACSTDSEYTHLAWLNTPRADGGIAQVKLPLLSDTTHTISRDYGVYSAALGHNYRGLFIIDNRSIIRQITINDLAVGRNVNEILRLIEALQFADTHGEVCPANWKPGSDTIVPHTHAAKKYFEKHGKTNAESNSLADI